MWETAGQGMLDLSADYCRGTEEVAGKTLLTAEIEQRVNENLKHQAGVLYGYRPLHVQNMPAFTVVESEIFSPTSSTEETGGDEVAANTATPLQQSVPVSEGRVIARRRPQE